MASQMDLKSTTRSRRQSRGDPSQSTTTIHRCYTSPYNSRSDLGTNNSPPMLSSALAVDSSLPLGDDSPPLPSTAFTDIFCRRPTPSTCRHHSAMTHRRCPRWPSPTSFVDVPRRRLVITARRPSPTSFTDVPRRRLIVTTQRPSPTSFIDVPRR